MKKTISILSTIGFSLFLSSCEKVNSTTYEDDTRNEDNETRTPIDPPNLNDQNGSDAVSGYCSKLNNDEVNTPNVLKSISCTVIYPNILTYVKNLDLLASTIKNECGRDDRTTFTPKLVAELKAVNFAWQKLDMVQWGPLAKNGNELRESIYSWPITSTCAIDRAVAENLKNGNLSRLPKQQNRLGLDALTYLLSRDGFEHGCRKNDREGFLENWQTSPKTEKFKAVCGYAESLLKDIRSSSYFLAQSWKADDFDLIRNSYENTTFAKENLLSLQDLSDALFYLDGKVKDSKISAPAGYEYGAKKRRCRKNCETKVEYQKEGFSIASLQANITAFKEIYRGGSDKSIGLKDLLDQKNPATAIEMDDAITELSGEVNSYSELDSLKDFIIENDGQSCDKNTQSPTRICSLFIKVKGVTDLLKTEFLKALELKRPATAGGDND